MLLGGWIVLLGGWILCREPPDRIIAESNLIGMPLTIAVHIVQCFHYLHREVSHAMLFKDVNSGGVRDFYLGLPSAVAVG